MSDILIENQILANQCAKYVGLCRDLEKPIADAAESGTTEGILQEARLRIQSVLCELQILKVQLSFNIKITEKQIVLFRNKFAPIIALYQKVFVPQIPCPMQEVVKRIELVGLEREESWMRDMRLLGLALNLFSGYTQRSNGYMVVLYHLYQFTAVFRNSILCRDLRPQMGKDNRISNLRRTQLEIFHHFADNQVTTQRTFFARAQSVASLENAIRITRAMVEVGFITDNEFCDAEYYKKQDEAFTKILVDTRDAAKKTEHSVP